ncbi:MAG: alpha/beta fold hydrolase, partial [Planctomycetes bacterium]|nr:alpha/beta fold hydrolase [Planctomycetota bacterium]
MTRRKAGILISTVATISACALWLGIQRSQPQAARQTPHTRPEIVVLLHGLGRSPASMKKLQECLEQAGYGVTNWGYSSTRHRIEEHGQRLHEFLAELDAEPVVQRIHIVGHSLGGIVARYALTIKTPAKMGRVVMLAPPNQGSASARKWAPFLGKVIKPLGQLSDDPKSAVNRLST